MSGSLLDDLFLRYVPLLTLLLTRSLISGCVMRAARNEIFGPGEVPRSAHEEVRDDKDLTSSRLQSELYCESFTLALASGCRLSGCGYAHGLSADLA